jgi:glucoamylase
VFDMPSQPVERYQRNKVTSPFAIWRFNQKCRRFRCGRTLRIEVLAPARVHWSPDGWQTVHDGPTTDTGLGIHHLDLPTERLAAGTVVGFTFFWPEAGRWEGQDFEVTVEESQ